jgi:hypothetical protein
MCCLGIRRQSSIPVFDGYLHFTIHIQDSSSFSAGSLTGGHCPHELWGIHTIFSVWYQCKSMMSALGFALLLAMKISKVGRIFGNSLRRHPQSLISPIFQSSPTRTRVLWQRWKTLSLWREGSSVASIANRILSRNAVAERVTKCSQLCGWTIASSVASQSHHF